MQVDAETLRSWFGDFNARYFSGGLPTPRFAVGRARTRLGTLSWKVARGISGTRARDFTIRVSNYRDAPETDFKNVLLHEMIHLCIVSRGLRDTSPHGKVFQAYMREINAQGWNVTITKRERGDGATPARSGAVVAERVIMAVTTSDGRSLLSVVNPRYVLRMDAVLRRSPNVRAHSWHVSSNAYFAQFPRVRTPKGRVVPREIYDRVVAQARPLRL